MPTRWRGTRQYRHTGRRSDCRALRSGGIRRSRDRARRRLVGARLDAARGRDRRLPARSASRPVDTARRWTEVPAFAGGHLRSSRDAAATCSFPRVDAAVMAARLRNARLPSRPRSDAPAVADEPGAGRRAGRGADRLRPRRGPVAGSGRTEGPSPSSRGYASKTPFGPAVFEQAGADLSAALDGLDGRSRRLVILDLDNVLWGGIVGEVGWEGITLGGHDHVGEAFVDFQRALKALTRRGIQLAIASKNDEAVALEAIDRHPEMQLRREDFVAWRINWSDKGPERRRVAARGEPRPGIGRVHRRQRDRARADRGRRAGRARARSGRTIRPGTAKHSPACAVSTRRT